jgi:uncharacterized membrane protein
MVEIFKRVPLQNFGEVEITTSDRNGRETIVVVVVVVVYVLSSLFKVFISFLSRMFPAPSDLMI